MYPMLEVLTQSGAVIRANTDTTQQRASLQVASHAFGGQIAQRPLGPTGSVFEADAVLTIMEQMIVGTTFTDTDGNVYELWPQGWLCNGALTSIPSPEHMTSATLPGGWSWSA